jgi:hypothetical protein
MIANNNMHILLALMKIRGLRIESFAVINLRGVSTNNSIICFIAMQTYKELSNNTFGNFVIKSWAFAIFAASST